RAAVVALGRRASRVVVAARRVERAQALIEELHRGVRARLEAVPLSELAPGGPGVDAHLARAGIVANATPVGMKGEAFVPFDFAATPRDCLFYDLVYTERQTSFLAGAARARRRGVNGLGMLLHQGALAFEAWTGVKPPLDVMRRALRAAAR